MFSGSKILNKGVAKIAIMLLSFINSETFSHRSVIAL